MKSFLGLVILLGIFHFNEGCVRGREKQNKNPRFNVVQQATPTRPPPVHRFQKTFGIKTQESTATCEGDANGKCRAGCEPGEYLKGRFDCKGSEHCCAPNPQLIVATTNDPDVVVEETTKDPEVTADKTTVAAEVTAEKTTEAAEVKAEETTNAPDVTAEKTTTDPEAIAEEATKNLEATTKDPEVTAEKTTEAAEVIAKKTTAAKVRAEEITKVPEVTAEKTTTGPETIAEETTKAVEGVAEEATGGPAVIAQETTEAATGSTLEVTAVETTKESPEIATEKATTSKTTIEHITEATTRILEVNAEAERTLPSLPLTRPTSVHGRNQKSFGIPNVKSTATCIGDANGTCKKECDQNTEYVKGLFDCGIETPICCGLR